MIVHGVCMFVGILPADEQYHHDVFQRWFHLRVGFGDNAVTVSSSCSDSSWKVSRLQSIRCV